MGSSLPVSLSFRTRSFSRIATGRVSPEVTVFKSGTVGGDPQAISLLCELMLAVYYYSATLFNQLILTSISATPICTRHKVSFALSNAILVMATFARQVQVRDNIPYSNTRNHRASYP